ncbi:hypothetical protein IQ07DRAFT_425850 [Pyrenochaeta sp. DS3sAY3a]|nr:hypothetical protein IQ07DRAFT_425850 [Pyrenochaeta sp. DS3sAY3a]
MSALLWRRRVGSRLAIQGGWETGCFSHRLSLFLGLRCLKSLICLIRKLFVFLIVVILELLFAQRGDGRSATCEMMRDFGSQICLVSRAMLEIMSVRWLGVKSTTDIAVPYGRCLNFSGAMSVMVER